MKSRNAFTMIELTFVIVILGILAAIAIPRLSATRDDAKNVKLAQNVMIGAGEIASYAVAKGETENNLSDMSNAIMSMIRSGDAMEDSSNRVVNVMRGDISNCIEISINTNGDDENLTVGFGNAGGDLGCLRLQELIDVNVYPMVLKGAKIVQ